jgi:hypothetical protein
VRALVAKASDLAPVVRLRGETGSKVEQLAAGRFGRGDGHGDVFDLGDSGV